MFLFSQLENPGWNKRVLKSATCQTVSPIKKFEAEATEGSICVIFNLHVNPLMHRVPLHCQNVLVVLVQNGQSSNIQV